MDLSSDRGLADLGDAVSTSSPRLAATVVILRPRGARFEVFMVRRNRAVAFMPHAWVFPGGRVDEADQELGRALSPSLPAPEPEPAVWLAAARETFEESGIWLGRGDPGAEVRRALSARQPTTDLRAVLQAPGRDLELARLRPWSRWITPREEPRRYDTWFFLAEVGQVVAVHDQGETVDSAWLDIFEAVEAAERGELPMAPPTWWTLRQLAEAEDLADLRSREVDLRPILPVLQSGPSGLSLVLPGHPSHQDPARPGLPSEITFGQGRWWAR